MFGQNESNNSPAKYDVTVLHGGELFKAIGSWTLFGCSLSKYEYVKVFFVHMPDIYLCGSSFRSIIFTF